MTNEDLDTVFDLAPISIKKYLLERKLTFTLLVNAYMLFNLINIQAPHLEFPVLFFGLHGQFSQNDHFNRGTEFQ